jgi:hypothetical protein
MEYPETGKKHTTFQKLVSNRNYYRKSEEYTGVYLILPFGVYLNNLVTELILSNKWEKY